MSYEVVLCVCVCTSGKDLVLRDCGVGVGGGESCGGGGGGDERA
jgi:hypothetical protein